VVDDEDSKIMPALQLAQLGKEWSDLAAGVLIDAMKAHERVEDEQAGLQHSDRRRQAAPIGLEIEAERGGGDDLDVEIAKCDTGAAAMPSSRRRTIAGASSAA